MDTLQLEIINDYENIHSVDPLYLMIGKVIGHIECNSVEAKNKSKYLVFTSSNESKEKVWDGIKNEIKAINGGKTGKYGKDFMKIKFNLDDDLPLNKQLKFPTVTIVVVTDFL